MTAVLRRVAAFYEVPNDVEAGVSSRMERQQILCRPGHRFHFVMGQQALRTLVGDRDVMAGQLDRLLALTSMTRVRLGVIPANAPYLAAGENHAGTVEGERATWNPIAS